MKSIERISQFVWLKLLRTYGDGDFAVISAGFAEADLEVGLTLSLVLDEFLTLENQGVGVLSLEFGAENKVGFSVQFTALFHHEATTVRLGIHTVSDGGANAAGLDGGGFGSEFNGEVERVTAGAVQSLEDMLELLGVPFVVLVVDKLSALDEVTVDGVEERLGVQVLARLLLALELGVGLGG